MAVLPMSSELEQLRVVLVRTRNPLNIGAVARLMGNFGAEHLRVVKPYDVAFREARSATSAAELLNHAEEYPSLADAVADCALVVGATSVTHREARHQVHRVEHAGSLIRNQLRAEKVALLFGSEKTGLSNNDLSHCHWLLRIPTREQHSSMNLAHAVAVCLYELVREGEAAQVDGNAPSTATALALEQITEGLLEILYTSGYLKSNSPREEEKVRRLVRRLNLDENDAELWLGILRQITWKIKSKH